MHFPDTDGRYKDADSIALLRQVVALVAEAGYAVANVDATILMERPKVGARRDADARAPRRRARRSSRARQRQGDDRRGDRLRRPRRGRRRDGVATLPSADPPAARIRQGLA